MRGTPLTYDKPERRSMIAESHFCEEIGSTRYCDKIDCPDCELPLDPEGVDDEALREQIEELEEELR